MRGMKYQLNRAVVVFHCFTKASVIVGLDLNDEQLDPKSTSDQKTGGGSSYTAE